MAVAGLISVESAFGPAETAERLASSINAKGLTLFARVDHAAGAAAVGLELRPTVLIIFGHAKGGTPLMQAAQTAGIDLPLKALVWQDDRSKTWLSYNSPAWLAERHAIGAETQAALTAITAVLEALAKAATSA